MTANPLLHLTVQSGAYLQTHQGIAIQNPEGKFFCGFKEDSKLVFNKFAQNGANAVEDRAIPSKESGAPVFLSTAEMKEQGFSAAVYPIYERGMLSSFFPSHAIDGCKAVIVGKDSALHTGLANADTCVQGRSTGYIQFSDDVKSAVKAVKGLLKKTFS